MYPRPRLRRNELGGLAKARERNQETFAAVSPHALLDAVTSADKCDFRRALQKKTGVDAGPEE